MRENKKMEIFGEGAGVPTQARRKKKVPLLCVVKKKEKGLCAVGLPVCGAGVGAWKVTRARAWGGGQGLTRATVVTASSFPYPNARLRRVRGLLSSRPLTDTKTTRFDASISVLLLLLLLLSVFSNSRLLLFSPPKTTPSTRRTQSARPRCPRRSFCFASPLRLRHTRGL